MSKIRKAARGEQCTMNIVGVCNFNPETTVLAHFPSEYRGMSLKSPDLIAGFACSACHDAIDGRLSVGLSGEDREYYMRRSMYRTHRRLLGLGILLVG